MTPFRNRPWLPIVVGFMLTGATPAAAGDVQDLVDRLRGIGTRRSLTETPARALADGVRELGGAPVTGPSAVSEALGILGSMSEPEDVRFGLLRGVALVNESSDPGIRSTLCQYQQNLSLSQALRDEATESLRLRCNGLGNPPGCNTCP